MADLKALVSDLLSGLCPDDYYAEVSEGQFDELAAAIDEPTWKERHQAGAFGRAMRSLGPNRGGLISHQESALNLSREEIGDILLREMYFTPLSNGLAIVAGDEVSVLHTEEMAK